MIARLLVWSPVSRLSGDIRGSKGVLHVPSTISISVAGSTLVIIAHRPNILASVDQILCLNEGFTDMLGSRDEVIARFTLPPPPPPEPGRIVSIADKRKSA